MVRKHLRFWLFRAIIAYTNWSARRDGSNQLKLLIVGSPKTGNMWLEKLLAEVYELPIYDLMGTPGNELPRIAKKRFVAHKHYRPRADLLAWGQQEGVQFLTMLRHPADMFVSFYYYVQNFAGFWNRTGLLGTSPDHVMIGQDINSAQVLAYLRTDFGGDLRKSLAWQQSGQALAVRYEDLHTVPVETLKRVTNQIEPVEVTRIEQAIEVCHIDKMRQQSKLVQLHCRQGKVGSWQQELSQAHIAILRECYAEELTLLGYDLDNS